jgi:hypothetical protein
MGDIVCIQIIEESRPHVLTDSVYEVVSDWQKKGYYVEIQYGGGFKGKQEWYHYSAMIIVRSKYINS